MVEICLEVAHLFTYCLCHYSFHCNANLLKLGENHGHYESFFNFIFYLYSYFAFYTKKHWEIVYTVWMLDIFICTAFCIYAKYSTIVSNIRHLYFVFYFLLPNRIHDWYICSLLLKTFKANNFYFITSCCSCSDGSTFKYKRVHHLFIYTDSFICCHSTACYIQQRQTSLFIS